MELRPGPGGNEADVAARLRRMLLDVGTTEKQIQGQIEQLTERKGRLAGQAAAIPAENADLRRRVEEELARIDTQLLDLRLQLDSVAQSRAEIAAQVQGFSQLAVGAEAEANITELRRVFAMTDIGDLDAPGGAEGQPGAAGQTGPDLQAELRRVTVDAELAALRREMGLPDPAPPVDVAAPAGADPGPAGADPGPAVSRTPVEPPPSAPPPQATTTPYEDAPPVPGSTRLPATSTAPVAGPAADPPGVPEPGTVLDPPPAEPTLPGLPDPKEPPDRRG